MHWFNKRAESEWMNRSTQEPGRAEWQQALLSPILPSASASNVCIFRPVLCCCEGPSSEDRLLQEDCSPASLLGLSSWLQEQLTTQCDLLSWSPCKLRLSLWLRLNLLLLSVLTSWPVGFSWKNLFHKHWHPNPRLKVCFWENST